MKFYPAFKPSFSKKVKSSLQNCIDELAISGNYGGSLIDLEKQYSNYHNNFFSISCSNGTAALHLACLGLGINEKHTVVVPSTTNMATFFAPMYTGAKVISCDVDPKSGLINLECLESICLTEKVDFVFIVHLYGHVVNPYHVKKISNKFGFKVVEDCAEAHFASFDNNHNYVGSHFDASCFSFYANKIISGGEGGIVLFKSEENFKTAKNLKNLGFSIDINSPSKFYHNKIGFNYRLPNTVAALICDSLENKNEILKKRQKIAHWYDTYFEEKIYIELLYSKLSSYRVNWVYCIKINKKYLNKFKSKNVFLSKLSKLGVEARDFFYPAELQPFYIEYSKKRNYSTLPNKKALAFYQGSVYLPVYLDLTEDDVKDICNIVDKLLLT